MEHPPGGHDGGVMMNKAGPKWDCSCLGPGVSYVAGPALIVWVAVRGAWQVKMCATILSH